MDGFVSRRAARIALVVGAGAVISGLSACAVGYSADVRNDTAQPVWVAIVHGSPGGQGNSLAAQRIGPNSRGRVVRNGVPYDWPVYLEADALGNPGWPKQLALQPGLMVVRVTQEGNVPTGRLHMEQIARDEPSDPVMAQP
ncbi:MAG: hypothetical protein ACREJD_15470 [Phycisphaerales bacterium]